MELLLSDQSGFSLLEFSQFFPIYAGPADATDPAALGPALLGAPRHGVWVGCSRQI